MDRAAVFLDHGADLEARDEELCTTPLGYAASSGKQPMVEFLIRRGAKLSAPGDPPWSTPMALAAYHGHDEIFRLLKSYEKQ